MSKVSRTRAATAPGDAVGRGGRVRRRGGRAHRGTHPGGPHVLSHGPGQSADTGAQEHAEVTEKLSPREREVADFVTQGLSDKEISSRLSISRRTAESHVAHILTKLGFSSRVQVAAYMARLS